MTAKKKRGYGLLAACFLVGIGLLLWILWGNTALMHTEYTVTDTDLPSSFDGYRIAQVSDLHNAQMGENNTELLAMLEAADPDIIVLTGDLIDSRRTDIAVALAFAAEAVTIAPTYYVSGNHESRISTYKELTQGLLSVGVVMLEDQAVTITRGSESLTLIGVADPTFETDDGSEALSEAAVMDRNLKALMPTEAMYTVVLSHRPELFSTYVSCGADLVFRGHAHGGQVRLPFVGGLFAPDQGLFPTYDGGMYTDAETTMIVSRGIGNSVAPLRVNNRPELVIAVLHRAANEAKELAP